MKSDNIPKKWQPLCIQAVCKEFKKTFDEQLHFYSLCDLLLKQIESIPKEEEFNGKQDKIVDIFNCGRNPGRKNSRNAT